MSDAGARKLHQQLLDTLGALHHLDAMRIIARLHRDSIALAELTQRVDRNRADFAAAEGLSPEEARLLPDIVPPVDPRWPLTPDGGPVPRVDLATWRRVDAHAPPYPDAAQDPFNAVCRAPADPFACCGGNDETPRDHCMDCPTTQDPKA